jgi:ribosomal protein S8E
MSVLDIARDNCRALKYFDKKNEYPQVNKLHKEILGIIKDVSIEKLEDKTKNNNYSIIGMLNKNKVVEKNEEKACMNLA